MADNLPKDIEKYGDSLARAWEQYLKIIDILIALSGATALVMINLLKEAGLASLKTPLGMITIASFGLALFFLALWRFAAQHFYEYETIGGHEIATRYFSHYGINEPITQAFLPQQQLRAFYRVIYRWVAHGSGILLGITWFSFLLLVFR